MIGISARELSNASIAYSKALTKNDSSTPARYRAYVPMPLLMFPFMTIFGETGTL
jgi:hypothetical protein